MNTKKLALVSAVFSFFVINSANAGESENAIVSGCVAKGGGPGVVAGCTGGLLTAKEASVCENDPANCFGRNNTLRIFISNPSGFVEQAKDDLNRSDIGKVANAIGFKF